MALHIFRFECYHVSNNIHIEGYNQIQDSLQNLGGAEVQIWGSVKKCQNDSFLCFLGNFR